MYQDRYLMLGIFVLALLFYAGFFSLREIKAGINSLVSAIRSPTIMEENQEYEEGPTRDPDFLTYSPGYIPVNPPGTIPINQIPGGRLPSYEQMGYLKNDSGLEPVFLPLYGRRTYYGSNIWEYFTRDSSRNLIKIPIETSQDELYDGDSVDVDGYSTSFMVSLYEATELRYLPY